MSKRSKTRFIATLFMLVALLAARAVDAQPELARQFAVEEGQGEVIYHLVHKLHKVAGHCRAVSGRAALGADGRLQVVIAVQAAEFDSGNANRDAHMKEVVEAARFPTIEVRAVASNVRLPEANATAQLTAKAQIAFHGVKSVVDVPVELTVMSDGSVRAVARFPISLDAHKVERPSLFFVKVDDIVQIEATVSFRESNR